MLKNDTVKNGMSSLGLYGTVPLRAWLPPLIINSGTRFGKSLVRHETFLAMNNKVCCMMENLFLSITANIFSL